MKIMNFSALAIAALAVSACSSSNSGGSRSFDQLAEEGQALITKYENEDVTPTSNVPTAGNATYNGVAAFGTTQSFDVQNAEALAAVSLEADFAANSISGTIDNFVDFDGERAPGSVAVTNGTIAGNAIEADLSGDLTIEGTSIAVGGDLAGNFVGANAEAIIGDIEADLTGPGGSETIFGVFGVEQ